MASSKSCRRRRLCGFFCLPAACGSIVAVTALILGIVAFSYYYSETHAPPSSPCVETCTYSAWGSWTSTGICSFVDGSTTECAEPLQRTRALTAACPASLALSCNETTQRGANASCACFPQLTAQCFTGDNCLPDIDLCRTVGCDGGTCDTFAQNFCVSFDPCLIAYCDPEDGLCKETPLPCATNDVCLIPSCDSELGGCVQTTITRPSPTDPCAIEFCAANGTVWNSVPKGCPGGGYCNSLDPEGLCRPACTVDADCDYLLDNRTNPCDLLIPTCNFGVCLFAELLCPFGFACNPFTNDCEEMPFCPGLICPENFYIDTDDCSQCFCNETACALATSGPDGLCSVGTCVDAPMGECAFAPRVCDDADACTTDSCTPSIGCTNVFAPCPESNDICVLTSCDAELGCQQTTVTTPNLQNPCQVNQCTQNGSVWVTVNKTCPSGYICDPRDVNGTCRLPCTQPGGVCDYLPTPTDLCLSTTAQCNFGTATCFFQQTVFCVDSTCNPFTGTCVEVLPTCPDLTCPAGTYVNTSDCSRCYCNASGCMPLVPVNKCNTYACNEPAGTCDFAVVDCGVSDFCTQRSCSSSTGCVEIKTICPPSNDSCITTSCNPLSGCVQTTITQPHPTNPCLINVCSANGTAWTAVNKTCGVGEICDPRDGTGTCRLPCDSGGNCAYLNQTANKCLSNTSTCTGSTCEFAESVVCLGGTVCDPVTGGCVPAPPCNNSLLCSVGSYRSTANCSRCFCSAASCEAARATFYNGTCRTSVCNTVTGQCSYPVRNCNDNNACTTDICDINVGCTNLYKTCPLFGCQTYLGCNASSGACTYAPVNCSASSNAGQTGVCDPDANGGFGGCTSVLGCPIVLNPPACTITNYVAPVNGSSMVCTQLQKVGCCYNSNTIGVSSVACPSGYTCDTTVFNVEGTCVSSTLVSVCLATGAVILNNGTTATFPPGTTLPYKNGIACAPASGCYGAGICDQGICKQTLLCGTTTSSPSCVTNVCTAGGCVSVQSNAYCATVNPDGALGSIWTQCDPVACPDSPHQCISSPYVNQIGGLLLGSTTCF